jgi:hypothetical protein
MWHLRLSEAKTYQFQPYFSLTIELKSICFYRSTVNFNDIRYVVLYTSCELLALMNS